MPMYEYRCTSCGDQVVTSTRIEDVLELKFSGHDEFGKWQDVDDSITVVCGPLKRTWSVGFQIKSTDWSHD